MTDSVETLNALSYLSNTEICAGSCAITCAIARGTDNCEPLNSIRSPLTAFVVANPVCPTGFVAASKLSKPCPNLEGLPKSVAVSNNHAVTDSAVKFGYAPISNATAPLTTGVAIDVPDIPPFAEPLPMVIDVLLVNLTVPLDTASPDGGAIAPPLLDSSSVEHPTNKAAAKR